MGRVSASSQCVPLRQYSMAPVGVTSSTLNGTMVLSRDTARSTSRRTWGDALAPVEKTTTNTRQAFNASTICWPYSEPAGMSRGAIQQRIPCFSSPARTASAVSLSAAE